MLHGLSDTNTLIQEFIKEYVERNITEYPGYPLKNFIQKLNDA